MARTIGLDYDFRNIGIVRDVIGSINRSFDPEWIKLSISPSGRGYHVKFKTNRDLSDTQCLLIRRLLGDDSNRISMVFNDDGTWVYRDVLFDMKLINGKIYKSVPLDVEQFYKYGKEVELK